MVKYEDIKDSIYCDLDEKIMHYGMNQTYAVEDEDTTIFTDCIATCTGLAIVAVDENNVIHRIISHNYAYIENFQMKQLEFTEQYLKSLPNIKKMRVIYCSMDSYKDFNNLTDIEKDSLLKLNKTFSFYKEKHPEFNMEFHQSWFLLINPDGNIEFANEKMLEEYISNRKTK